MTGVEREAWDLPLVLTPGLIPVDPLMVREWLGAALLGCTEDLAFACQLLGKGLSLP